MQIMFNINFSNLIIILVETLETTRGPILYQIQIKQIINLVKLSLLLSFSGRPALVSSAK